jgi:5-hmdU DNA kinase-like protein
MTTSEIMLGDMRTSGDIDFRRDCAGEFVIGSGRVAKTTPVFDTYWRFAAARQEIFMRRVGGEQPPWTADPVLAMYRFTNVYRASDRVTQYLIRNVLYDGAQTAEEIVFRALLFKFFNRIETWETLLREIGSPSWKSYDFDRYARVLDAMLARGEPLYSAAYIMPSPSFGDARKHRNHLCLLEHMMRGRAPCRIATASSLRHIFDILRSFPSIGNFLGFQFSIDLNYSSLVDFSELDFVVPGPGARDGIRKCFSSSGGLADSDIIRVVTESADEHFRRLGLAFTTLWGRPLHPVDCQNLFCEVSKYARVVHPDVTGDSGRFRIKQKFVPTVRPLAQWYPPKWGLSITTARRAADTASASLRPHVDADGQDGLRFAR